MIPLEQIASKEGPGEDDQTSHQMRIGDHQRWTPPRQGLLDPTDDSWALIFVLTSSQMPEGASTPDQATILNKNPIPQRLDSCFLPFGVSHSVYICSLCILSNLRSHFLLAHV